MYFFMQKPKDKQVNTEVVIIMVVIYARITANLIYLPGDRICAIS